MLAYAGPVCLAARHRRVSASGFGAVVERLSASPRGPRCSLRDRRSEWFLRWLSAMRHALVTCTAPSRLTPFPATRPSVLRRLRLGLGRAQLWPLSADKA